MTPQWVFAANVPSVTHTGVYLPEQIDPVFWDDHYLAIQERFIAALGKYLDGKPGLEFIDIGSIGEWGEMHLSRWTPAELARTGFTEEKYIAAYSPHHRCLLPNAFPHTRVFLNVGGYATINDYATIRGLHFRQDGLTPSGPSANVGELYYKPYARRGTICNYEFCDGYASMLGKGWGVKETVDKGLSDPISYLHLNLFRGSEFAQAPEEVKQIIRDAANRIGYRLPYSACKAIRQSMSATNKLDAYCSNKLVNLGVAPCYDSYALHWALLREDGTVAAESTIYPQRPTTQWWPGEAIKEDETLRTAI